MKRSLSAALAVVMFGQILLGSGSSIADAAASRTQMETTTEVSTFTLKGDEKLTPANGKLEVSKKPELAIEMTELVKRGEGSIHLQRMSDNAEIKTFQAADIKIYDVPFGNEVGAEEYGTYITLPTFTDELASGGYYILIDQGLLLNEKGENFTGIQDASTWRFWTKGMGDVVVNETTPAHGASKVLPAATLALRFAKEMYPAAGDIQIMNRTTGQVVDTISVTSPKVSGGGSNTIRIEPTSSFVNNTTYDVIIPSEIGRAHV